MRIFGTSTVDWSYSVHKNYNFEFENIEYSYFLSCNISQLFVLFKKLPLHSRWKYIFQGRVKPNQKYMLQCMQNFYLLSLSSSYLYILPSWNINHLMHKFPKLASIMRSLKKYYTAVLFYNTLFKPCMITGGDTNPITSLFVHLIHKVHIRMCRVPQCMSPHFVFFYRYTLL